MSDTGFYKIASVSTIAVATFSDDGGFNKSASYDENGAESAYFNGRKPLDIRAALEIVANEYDISSDPNDYFFEAIRGNTTNVANDNKDAFHKNELLRFDHRLGKQVYRTYENKPHQINHRAENPKNARGFILDAHYNDSAPPLEVCPNKRCGNKTADRENRDPETGIHCNKCGSVVKDEFVELLVAIDTKKDPAFAKGVQSGVLKHGSMGCSCLRTRCNVCNKVAYSRSEFCKHISSGKKGAEFDESEPGFNPVAFVIKYPKDRTAGRPVKTAVAFEWCEGVIFDEYSRVHDPADPKAEQYEILKMTAQVEQLSNSDMLKNESEILMLQAKVAELEKKIDNKLSKIAQAGPMPPMPPAPAGLPPPGSSEPPLPIPDTEGMGKEESGDVNIYVNTDEEGVNVKSPELEDTSLEKTPIEEMNPEDLGATPAGPGGTLTPAAMGISTPKASKTHGDQPMLRFADSYQHLKAEITSAGNVRICDNDGTLFVVKPSTLSNTKIASNDPEIIAKNVLTMIAQYGIGGAISRTNAVVGPRIAQVLQHYHDDMMGNDRGSESGSVLDDADTDAKEQHGTSKETDTATSSGSMSDRADEYDDNSVGLKNNTLDDRDTDLEDEQHDRDPGNLSATDMKDSDMRDKREDRSLSDSTIDDISLDHKGRSAAKKCKECKCDPCECKDAKGKKKASACDKCGSDECACDANYDMKKHSARLEKLYAARLEKKIAELETEKERFVANIKDRFSKAVKIVAKRQALNLEYSPIKTAIGIALSNPRSLGDGYDYMPMDPKTAVTLVEASFNEPLIEGTDKQPWELYIDGLIERAAEVMQWNDETLIQVEADLSHQRVATVQVDDSYVNRAVADVGLRQAAAAGNMQLSPQHASDNQLDKSDKRSAIRQAVGTTKVASLAGSR